MKRIYHHYKHWEDWKDGLYAQKLEDADEIVTARCVRLLSHPESLKLAMNTVVDEWKNSAQVNLTNRARNRQAWLGQAACCYECGATEDMTKNAWHRLMLGRTGAGE